MISKTATVIVFVVMAIAYYLAADFILNTDTVYRSTATGNCVKVDSQYGYSCFSLPDKYSIVYVK